jgi:hypothetical protein
MCAGGDETSDGRWLMELETLVRNFNALYICHVPNRRSAESTHPARSGPQFFVIPPNAHSARLFIARPYYDNKSMNFVVETCFVDGERKLEQYSMLFACNFSFLTLKRRGIKYLGVHLASDPLILLLKLD